MVDDTLIKTKANIYNGNLEYWMTHLPPFLKSLPIIHLAIPGSHNTMTYTIERYSDVGPDEPLYLRLLGRVFPFVSKPLIYNWSVTQYENVTEQLNGGIRYLDLRLATKPHSEAVYFLHGLYGSEVTEPLGQIEQWLSSHPNEIVILDCQHFYSFTLSHHHQFVDTIKRIFGNKICPSSWHLDQMSLQWFNERRYQIVIIYRNDIAREEKNVWSSGFWPTPWPNTVDPTILIDFLDLRLRSRVPDIGFVSQCLLTPDTRYVLRHLCGGLQKDLSKICRDVTIPWIKNHKPGNFGINIIITDYVSHENFLFSRTVIQRNNELLRVTESSANLPKY